MAPAEISNPSQAWREFLEDTPAYVSCQIEGLLNKEELKGMYGTTPSWSILSPRIQLYCDLDKGFRGFQTESQIYCKSRTYEFITYTCRDCGEKSKTFAVLITQDKEKPANVTVMKLGEYPPFGSHVAPRLQKMLSKEDLELYRKGLRSEREGHGIGAAAYYRRVVENQWKALVEKLRDAAVKLRAQPEKLAVFDEALQQTQFSTAVDMLKNAIPSKLLILDGRNPLTLLYSPLSVQLHDLSDEECLQQATDIRVVLNELFDNISLVLADDEALKGTVGRLRVLM